MRCLVRAGLAAALVALVFAAALAADKAFKPSGLDEAAIKLEAQIKSDAGNVGKPAATLRRFHQSRASQAVGMIANA